ncbi:MAG TPA: aldo/keto reductase [Kofleriaceae bacterium]|jgi:diketogulonate reductase-like aldo/keto reductase
MQVKGVSVPDWLYGTAWKEDATESLVKGALAAGFRGIDTANQRKHYYEEGAGRGIARAGVPRDELFLQTKFTFRGGQDDRLPYDPDAPIAQQVAQSHARSLEHLGVERVDSLILHGPSQHDGLGAADHEAWRALEALHHAGAVSLIGISNVTAAQVDDLAAFAEVAPAFVQNRCYASRGWDADVRAACDAHGIRYQAFSLLTANRDALAQLGVRRIATAHRVTPAQIVFRFAQQVGMLPLTGTRSATHMREDLAIGAIELSAEELAAIRTAGAAS